jgi:hypothetical protein
MEFYATRQPNSGYLTIYFDLRNVANAKGKAVMRRSVRCLACGLKQYGRANHLLCKKPLPAVEIKTVVVDATFAPTAPVMPHARDSEASRAACPEQKLERRSCAAAQDWEDNALPDDGGVRHLEMQL